MTKRTILTACFSSAGILILILDGQTALAGGAAGLELCLKTVIPSLFPFLFLCSMLTGALWGQPVPWLRPLATALGIPEGGESLLVAGILGGYPAGAQAIGETFRNGLLSREDAEHLLSFCSNAGPAFLFGITARQFPELSMVWALWAIQLLSAMAVGMWHRQKTISRVNLLSASPSVYRCLIQTVRTMAVICGWIMLFQILLRFLSRWFLWHLSQEMQVLVTGLLELSSGCCSLPRIESIHQRFLVCSLMLSFGGLCVTMQTASVIDGLSIGIYLRGKLMQTCAALFLSGLYLLLDWPGLTAAAALLGLAACLMKKRVDFPEEPVYNTTITAGRKQIHAVPKKN